MLKNITAGEYLHPGWQRLPLKPPCLAGCLQESRIHLSRLTFHTTPTPRSKARPCLQFPSSPRNSCSTAIQPSPRCPHPLSGSSESTSAPWFSPRCRQLSPFLSYRHIVIAYPQARSARLSPLLSQSSSPTLL